jgi:DNA polymerase-3 subunit beta
VRIRAERDDLADVLGRASRGVGTRSPQAILQGLLCEVTGSQLRVTGTDNELTVRTSLEVEVMEEGRTVIPARLASEAVRKLPAGAVVMNAVDGEVEITGGGPRFRLRELNVDDYPQIPPIDTSGGIDYDGGVLVKALAQAGVAASTDDARPILTGVHFESEESSLRLVATDSYRLAVRDLPGAEAPATGLVPFRGLRELGRSIGAEKVNVAIHDREATFSSDRGALTVRLIEGSFPNYRQLFPEAYPNRLRVGKAELLEAVGRSALVAEDHIPVRLAMKDGGVQLSVTRQDVGGEVEMLEGDFTGTELEIAFNPRYLTDGVNAVEDDEILIETVDGLKPGLVRGASDDSFRYLLMPIRL